MATLPRGTIIRARHVGYHYSPTSGILTPIVRKLNTAQDCVANEVEFPEARQVRYGATTGHPVVIRGLQPCCGWTSDDRTGTDCWPGGYTPSFEVRVQNGQGCPIKEGDDVITLSPSGSVTFTHDFGSGPEDYGTLTMTFGCDPLLSPNPLNRFYMIFGGCAPEPMPGLEKVIGSVVCTDPLTIVWEYSPGTDCCFCNPSNIIITALLNCDPRVFGRHIGYKGASVPLTPLIAISNVCPESGVNVERTCCPDRALKETMVITMAGCFDGEATLTFDPTRFGDCSPFTGAWTNEDNSIDWWCDPATGTWALAMTGCVNVLTGPTSVVCSVDFPFMASGSEVSVTGTCCPLGAPLAWVIRELEE